MQVNDNINHLLGDDLKKTISPGSKLKIAASCFSIYAFEALKAELEQIESLEFIFTAPNWLTYSRNLTTNIFSKDRFAYDVLCHTDLLRDSGMSISGMPLNRVNWGMCA